MRIRVLVADDHPVYREAVTRAVSRRPDLELVGEASDGAAAFAAIQELTPDVAILDIEMPELDGPEVIRRIAKAGLETRVILLTGHAASDAVYQGLEAGAKGYLLKTAGGAAICDAVGAVMRGQTVLSPDVQNALSGEIRERAGPAGPLTPREREVLQLTADGRSAAQVAEDLHISQSTVRTHLRNVYDKLGVVDRAAAVAHAMRVGLIE